MTKKILAVLLALAMIFSLCAVDLTAAEEVETLYDKTLTEAYGGSWMTIVLQEDTEAFIEACKADDATVTVTATGVKTHSWAQFILQNKEGSHTLEGGKTSGNTYTISGAIVAKTWEDEKFSDSEWYQVCFQGTSVDPKCDINIKVTAPKKNPTTFVVPVKEVLLQSTSFTGGWKGFYSKVDDELIAKLAKKNAVLTIETDLKEVPGWFQLHTRDAYGSGEGQLDLTGKLTSSGVVFTASGADVKALLDKISGTKPFNLYLNNGLGDTSFKANLILTYDDVRDAGTKPEKTPKSYELNKALDVEPVTENGAVTITPNGTVKTQSLYFVFDEPAPTAGDVSVYFDEGQVPLPATVEMAANGGKNVGNGTIFGYAEIPFPVAKDDIITVNVEGTTTNPSLLYRMYLVDGGKNDNCLSNNGVATICDIKDGKVTGSYELKATGGAVKYIQFKTYYGNGTGDFTIDKVTVTKGSASASASAEPRVVTQHFEPGTWEVYMAIPSEYKYTPINHITITLEDTSKTVKLSKGNVLVMSTAKTGKTFAYAIQLSDTMHGYLVNGRMLPMPHTFVNDVCSGCGFKKKVSIAVETEKEDDKEEAKEETKKETSNKPYYTMTKTTGQNFENNISSKTGVELEISDGMTRLATDWVNKDAWDQLFKAMKDHKDGNIVMTYTGTITEIGVEHDNGGAKERDKVEITDVAEVDGKNVYTIAVADFLPVIEEALEDESWKNFYVIPDEKDGAVLYGFQIARPAADDAEGDAEEEVELPDPYVFPLEADTELTEWKTLLNYENEDWGSDTFWTPMWGDSKIEIEYTGDGEPELIAQYAGAKGYFAAISPESVKDTKDGTRLATFSVEKLKEALVRDANKKGFKQDDESDPYGFFAISIDGTIWGEDGQVVENLVYKSGRVIPSKDPAKDPEYTDFYTIKPGTELSEWTPLVWWEGNDDITEIFNWLIWLDGAKIEINYTGDALLLIAQYGDGNGNDGYSSVPEPDEIIENEDGSKTAVYDCANYIKAVRADAEQYNFDPYETVEWVYDNGHVYGYTLDGRFWDEEGNQTNSIFNWAKISAPAANN